jgi:hypothetical protein
MGAEQDSAKIQFVNSVNEIPEQFQSPIQQTLGILPGATVLTMSLSEASRKVLLAEDESKKNGTKEYAIAVLRGAVNGVAIFAGLVYAPSDALWPLLAVFYRCT